jgi:hypothetical protein
LDNAAANSSDITPRPNADGAFTAFTHTLGPYGVETLENIDTLSGMIPGVAFDPNLTFLDGNGTGSNTIVTGKATGVFVTPGTSAQNYAIGFQSMPETDANFPGQVNTVFTLDQPVTAFGLYVMQAGDATNHTQMTFQLSNSATNSTVDHYTFDVGPGFQSHNIFFLGLATASPFDQVTILEHALDVGGVDDLSDGMVYDNIVAGHYVPEPGSFVLLSLGGAFAYAVGRPGRFRRGGDRG